MEHKEISIIIDKKEYKAPKEEMTGAELKVLGNVGSDRDLFEEMPGKQDDKKISDNETVHLKDGMHFYSVPKTINPGAK